VSAHATTRTNTAPRGDTVRLHSPALLSHAQFKAIEGLPAVLRQQKRTASADAVQAIVESYEALRNGGFIVVQEGELARAAVALHVGPPDRPDMSNLGVGEAAALRRAQRPKRRWWRFG
jgi:hypothetical protein